ncbi:hypothetical protein [Cellulomonas sp. URHD0024]|uniref:hypothetical protein n=1 Tax=Cellulomonas sp. URHD0024 TaxID=1302620 RepID=UPI00040BA689|nr:hypothetical protein [Cellulomonas sp. URHD0024]
MRPNVANNGPLVQDDNANALGVRVTPPSAAADVVTYLQGGVPWVSPLDPAGDPQGISVAAGSGCNLPSHRRPRGAPWNGTGAVGLQMWQLDTAVLVPAQLQAVPAPVPGQPQHEVISPAQLMSLALYRGYIAATAPSWQLSPAPVPACAAAADLTRGAPVDAHLVGLLTGVAGGEDPTELVAALRAANEQGTSAAELVAGIEASVQRLEEGGDDDGAEVLRGVLDRITGYCAPADRIVLT